MKMNTPYDFVRTLQVINRFSPGGETPGECMKIGLRFEDRPLVMAICAVKDHPDELSVSGAAPASELESLARWVLFDELDLEPFYRLIGKHAVLAPMVQALGGVKPVRPASLYEMAITVITEQQISLAAANRIRSRLAERFGDLVDGLWVFPAAHTLAAALLDEIAQCGYSRRKAEYIQDFSQRVADGSLDLDALKTLPEEDVIQRLLAIRGWGMWSANYFLIRGLARPDSIPADDLAVRSVVGKYLGEGGRVSAVDVERLLEPFRPYRGIVSFYLLAYERM